MRPQMGESPSDCHKSVVAVDDIDLGVVLWISGGAICMFYMAVVQL